MRYLSQGIAIYETHMEQAGEDPEHTLQLALTEKELTLVQYGLAWLQLFYGEELVNDLSEKIVELVRVQEFCQCPRCIKGRGEDVSSD